jgi:DNA-binding beta-propeller fold protein YncE
MPYSVSRKPATVSKTKSSKFSRASDYTRYTGVLANVGTDTSITSVGTVGTFVDPPTVTTLTGFGPLTKNRDGPPNVAQFQNPQGMVTDSSGNIYFCDTDNHRIRKHNVTTGAITTIAGSTSGFFNASGTDSRFNQPQCIAINPNGTKLFVSDTGNHAIRVLELIAGYDASIGTLAGTGSSGSTNAEIGTDASFSSPQGLAVSSDGNYVYVADSGNNRIRVIIAEGIYTGRTLTLIGSSSGSANGTSGTFNGPKGIVINSLGTILYVADTGNHRIRKITDLLGTPSVSTLAGSSSGYTDATGASAQFSSPIGIVINETNGKLFVADSGNLRVRRVDVTSGLVNTVVGSSTLGTVDGTGTDVRFKNLTGVAINSSGVLYVSDRTSNVISTITIPAAVTEASTLAGSSSSAGFVNGDGLTEAKFNFAYGLVVDPTGTNVYVADTGNHCIRKIVISTGVVSTFAGIPESAGFVNGAGIGQAKFFEPRGITIDSAGENLYVADTTNNRIRKIIISTAAVSTVAGSNSSGGFADGDRLSTARFNNPVSVVIYGTYLFVADSGNQCIRRISLSTDDVSTPAGDAGIVGDDDGGGNFAQFNYPSGIVIDSTGTNLYIVDTGNHLIRKMTGLYDTTSSVTTLAGSAGNSGFQNGTNGTSALFDTPTYITLDSFGNLFVTDKNNNCIRKIVISTGGVSTYIGSSSYGLVNGNISDARFWHPEGITIDLSGNLYISDLDNNRIRKVGLVDQYGVSALNFISPSYTNGSKTVSTFDDPRYAVLFEESTLYVLDSNNNCIRSVNISTGVVSTVAGSEFGTSGNRDGTGTTRSLCGLFNTPKGIVMNSSGTNLYISDTGNHRICKVVISSGEVTTLAGSTSGTSGTTNDTGTAARFNSPEGLTVDSSETNLYVADTGNHSIRKIVISTGVVTTFAGSSGTSGNTNNTGSSARFNGPRGITTDSTNLYVADSVNTRIRKIVISTAVVTTLAGSTTGYTDDTGTSAKFKTPATVNIDRAGTGLFVCDDEVPAIRKIVISTGVVSTITGGATAGYNDGLLTAGLYGIPSSVSEGPSGKLYFCDRLSTTNKIRNTTPETTRTVTGDDVNVKGSSNKILPSASFFTAIRSVILRN